MSDEIEEQDISKFSPEFLNAKYQRLVEDMGGSMRSGICLNECCDFTTDEVEIDSTASWCEVCETPTVCAWLHLVPPDPPDCCA